MTDDDIRALVADKAKAVDREDFFALLGVTGQSSKAEIAKAYFELAKILHPDRISKRGLKDLDAEAKRVFGAVTEAQSVLMDPKRRDDYQRKHPMAGASTEEIQARVSTQSTQELLRRNADELGISSKEAAKVFFHKGVSLVKKGAYGEAEGMLQKALDADPDNARYLLQMGWAVFQNTTRPDGKRLSMAREHLEKAVTSDPDNPEAHYYMALLWKQSNDNDKCRGHLQKALEKRPNFIEARRELRLLEMRGLAPQGSVPASKSTTKPSVATSRTSSSPGGKAAEPEKPASKWPFGLDRLFKKK